MQGHGQAERDRAVLLAREGNYDEALPILRRLHADAPDNLALLVDLVATLSWAGKDREALELGIDLPFEDLEFFVAETLGRSARNLGRPELAATLYAGVLDRDAGRIESHIGTVLSTLEQGDISRAEAHLRRAEKFFSGHPELLLAAGHVLRAAGRPLEAALTVRQAADAGADPAEARRLEVFSLADGGAVFLAAERMQEAREIFHGGERGRILALRGSRSVQWSAASPPSPHPDVRYDAVDRALALVDSALAGVDPADGFPHRQLRFDRILALRMRARFDEVLEEVATLDAEGVEIPPYVDQAAADAHLHRRKPQQAEVRYRAALHGMPGHPESTIGLFYALLQQERYVEAREIINALVQEQPDRRTAEGLKNELPNPDRLAAEIAKRLGLAFRGELRAAQREFEELSALAPLNLDIRQEFAWIYLWRGWPRRALTEQARILALDPHHVGARIGRASSLLALGDRPVARATLDTLIVLAPENQHVQRTAEIFRVDGLWELTMEGSRGRSTGGYLGTRDDILATRLTAPPIGDRLRLFARWRRSSATYPYLVGKHDRVAAGAWYQTRGLRLTGEASADREDLGRVGAGGRIDLNPDDHWSLSLRGSSHADELPLQADPALIDGWMVGASLGRRASERQRWSVDAAYLEMSDGNTRWSGYSALEQELLQRPMGRISGLLELYGARNSRQDAPYFNPSRTFSGSATAQWRWTMWRSYESSLTQRIRTTGGLLLQDGYGEHVIYSAEYAHEWTLSRRFSLDYGVHWGRPVYDGQRERRTAVHGMLAWRFP